MTVAANLARIRESLGSSAVKIVAVSKYVGVEEIEEAVACGVTEFGENRIQDALKKQEDLPPQVAQHIHWHFIGHLQSNKAKKAIGRFVLIHSVDSESLAEELSREAVKKEISQDILLQIKVVDDPDKSGFTPQTIKESFARIIKLPGLKIKGLMTMTPLTKDQDIWRECFLGLKKLSEELEKQHSVRLEELSMGMTDDYLEAVKYGATMVRIGRAIFKKSEN